MKKIFISLFIIFLILIVGIIFKDINIKDIFATQKSRFIYTGGLNVSDASIIVDTETGVMYLWKTDYYKGGLTVMLDRDGKPLIYNK